MFIEQVLDFATSNARRIIIAVIAISLVLFLFNYTFINISTSSEGTLTIQSDPEKSSRGREIGPGLHLVPTGDHRIELRNDTKSTRTNVHTRPLWVTKKSISLHNKKGVSKLTLQPDEANCYIPGATPFVCISGKIYEVPDGVVSKKPVVKNMTIINRPASYQKGILAIATFDNPDDLDNDPRLIYFNGESVKVVLPDTSRYLPESRNIEIGTTGKGGHYTLSKPDGSDVYLFSSLSDREPERIAIDDQQNSLTLERAYTNTTQSHVYTALVLQEPAQNKEDHDENIGDVYLNKYSIQSKKQSVIATPDSFDSAATVYMTDTHIYTWNGLSDEVSIYVVDGSRTRKVLDIQNVSTVGIANGDLYYSLGSVVYKYSRDEDASFAVATIKGVSVSSIVGASNDVIVSGDSTKRTVGTASYLILDEEYDSSKHQVANLIPYSLDELPIFKSDYIDDTLIFNIKLKSQIFNTDTGGSTYDQNEFELKKGVVLRRLQTDGVDPSKYNIVFNPGP